MVRDGETLDPSVTEDTGEDAAGARVPGLLLVFCAGRPAAAALPLIGGAVEIGRDHPIFAASPDPRVSRRHVQVACEDGHFHVSDLESRNGTVVDGQPLRPGPRVEVSRVLRTADSLFVPVKDIRPFLTRGVKIEGGLVLGPTLQRVLVEVVRAAQLGPTLHITGESGTGKEGIARAYHDAVPRPGRLVAVNCAAIPEGVAERLLFGTRRGAYSGADADAEGYAQAADGGTLFLDEVAELGLPVQAKLLRMLETREVLPLGASRPRAVDVRVCTATHRDLRAQVKAGKLREDLYFRIGRPAVALPPLRQRPEEVPWLIAAEAERVAPGLRVHPSLVEVCLLRAWPGNVRELLAEVRMAVQGALGKDSQRVEAKHLDAEAGTAFAQDEPAPADPMQAAEAPSAAAIKAALRRSGGNVTAAARALDVHRTQLRRWIERHGIDPRHFEPRGKS